MNTNYCLLTLNLNNQILSIIFFLLLIGSKSNAQNQTVCDRCFDSNVYDFLYSNKNKLLTYEFYYETNPNVKQFTIPIENEIITIEELRYRALECLRNKMKLVGNKMALPEMILLGYYIPNLDDLNLAYEAIIDLANEKSTDLPKHEIMIKGNSLWKEEFGILDTAKTYNVLVGKKFEKITGLDLSYRLWAAHHLTVGSSQSQWDVPLLWEKAKDPEIREKGIPFYNIALGYLKSSKYQTNFLREEVENEFNYFLRYFNYGNSGFSNNYSISPYRGHCDYLSMRHLYCHYGYDTSFRFYELVSKYYNKEIFGSVIPSRDYQSQIRFMLKGNYTGVVTLESKVADMVKIHKNESVFKPDRIDLPNNKTLLILKSSTFTEVYHINIPPTNKTYKITGHVVKIEDIIKEAAILNVINALLYISTDDQKVREMGDRLANLINSAFRSYNIDETKRSFILNELSDRLNDSIGGNLITAQIVDSAILIFDAMSKYAFVD